MTPVNIARRCAWIAFPLAGAVWIVTRYDQMWFFLDEWGLISRTVDSSGYHEMFAGYGGHLYALPYWVFYAQVHWVGLESHWLVFMVFCVSLVALQISVAAVLVRLGLPSMVALIAATVVTYFGPGSTMMTAEVYFGANLALALCFAAAFVALRDNIGRGEAIATAALLITAFGMDSGLASCGAVFAGTLVILLWPRRLAAVALGPTLVAIVAWELLDRSVSPAPAPLDQSLNFAFELAGRAAGGLVGGATVAGSIGLGLALICVGVGLARRRLPRRVVACFVGGFLAAFVTVVAITYGRAGFVTSGQLGGSQYVHQVAVFLLLAFAPAVTAAIRPTFARPARLLAAVTAGGLVAVFVLNLSSLWPVRQLFEAWGTNTKLSVRRSVTVLTVGCGQGTKLDAWALPVDADSGSDPFGQIPVRLLRELLHSGALTREFGKRPTPEVRKATCPLPDVISKGCVLSVQKWKLIHRLNDEEHVSITRIARQVRLSQSDVHAALGSEVPTCYERASADSAPNG
jgi:hypothetical protein